MAQKVSNLEDSRAIKPSNPATGYYDSKNYFAQEKYFTFKKQCILKDLCTKTNHKNEFLKSKAKNAEFY